MAKTGSRLDGARAPIILLATAVRPCTRIGSTRGPQVSTSTSPLSEDTNRTFTVENAGHIEIWRFYFDSESSPFAYSPTMIFNSSTALSTSQLRTPCNSLWTHMYCLNYISSGAVWPSWGDLE